MSKRLFGGADGKKIREAAHQMVQQGKLPGPRSRFNEEQTRILLQAGLDSALLSLCSWADVTPRRVQEAIDRGADPNAWDVNGTAAEVLGRTLFREAFRSPEGSQRDILDSLYVLERAGADVEPVKRMDARQVGIDGLLIEHIRGFCEQEKPLDRDYVASLIEMGANPDVVVFSRDYEGLITMARYLDRQASRAMNMAGYEEDFDRNFARADEIRELKGFLAGLSS